MKPTLPAIAVLTALIGCDDPLPPQTTALRFEGVVADAVSGQPIDGAAISLWNRFNHPFDGTSQPGTWVWDVDTTDVQGSYAVRHSMREAFFCDGFHVTATAHGYRADTASAAVFRCDPVRQSLNFDLLPH